MSDLIPTQRLDGIPRWALRAIAGAAVTIAMSLVVVFLAGALRDIDGHLARIQTLENRWASVETILRAQEKRLDRLDDKLDEILKRLPK